jgi:outer membrane biosynthesis protein TonB
VLPGRLGLRFALEALFLVLLAIGLGLADVSVGWIVLVMAVGWLLVALVEFTAERISASPLSYLLPQRAEQPADEPEASWPMPEERTVVAPPPERPAPEPEPEPEAAPQPELPAAAEPNHEEEPAPAPRRRRRSFLRRREPDAEPESADPPRHVKLLPRRSAPKEESRAAQEVAELFDEPDESERGG